jgi:DNA-binding MurR/RpiR family transcriptional regulator
MAHQYKAGDVVTVFQISPANELVVEGKATIRKGSQKLMSITGSSSSISQA